jgi:tripartite-type tricarboxylate transporter receptor subunit TctC
MFSACALAACAPAAAQQYPHQPIRVIVPFTPGGGTDFLSRTVAAKLSDSVKWNVVAENRPGAGGTIGITTAARAKPDGYEIVMGQVDNLAVAPSLYTKLAYDPVKDFEPIGIVGEAPLVVVASKNGPYKSLKDLIAAAKKAPGTINYGSPGAGTITHLAAELLQVPYKGSGPAMADLLGGQVPVIFTSIPSAAPQIKAGSAVPLAVTSLKRSPAMPDVPTVAESGYPDFDVRVWYGLLAPANTPKPIIQTLNTELNKILAMKDVQDALAAQGATAMPTTPAQFSQTIAADYKKWRGVIQSANVKLE